MEKILELKYEKRGLKKKAEEIFARAEKENRITTENEQIEIKDLQGRIFALAKEINDAETDFELRRKQATLEGNMKYGKSNDNDVNPEKEFRNIGEMLNAVARLKADGVRDSRLDELYEKREQTMGVGSGGGYALPEQFDSTLREVVAQESIVRPRATVIPAGDPPDAKLNFPALDQTSGENIYGGVQVVHTGEGVTMTETDAKLRQVSLEPKEISAYIVITDKLLRNWSAAGAFITRILSQAMSGQEDMDFMLGNGVNKALGFINCAAGIPYARSGAGAIDFTDCYGMMAHMLMRGSGSYVWLASQTTIPQLAAMVDAGNHAVWLGGTALKNAGAQGLPGTLLGLPVIFADRLPALGNQGRFEPCKPKLLLGEKRFWPVRREFGTRVFYFKQDCF